MYIYGNNCGVNNECESGYSLYFPCIKTITRGENACFDFYILDNATKEEVDLREVDGITLNLSGRYNCNFGSFSYPENIKSSQVENFSDLIYDVDFSNIINRVKLYIDIVDENHNLIESNLFDENLLLDIAIEGNIGYFLKGSDKYGILNLNGYDTYTYMFLGWNIDENDGECDSENIYDFLIKSKNLTYNIDDDCVIRAVYQKRRAFDINMAKDNCYSSFIVEYMGKKTELREGEQITALEGHDIKVSCIPNDILPYKFVMWDDEYKNPYRIFNINGDICLKAQCELNSDSDDIEYIDDIDASTLNNFKNKNKNIYPEIIDNIFVDSYFIDNIYINKCEIDVLNDTPYIKIIDGGYIQIDNIYDRGNLKLSINNIGGDCNLFINNYNVKPSIIEKNEFVFEYEGGTMTITGNNCCVFGFSINKEYIIKKGKCSLCLSSDDTLKLHPGELVVDGGVIVNGNPYGISPVKFGKVTNVKPLIIK
jgi:hypothetical protein